MSTSAERMRRLRARRAGVLAPADGVVRDESDRLLPAVEATLSALELAGVDAAAATLARGYARAVDGAIDEAWALRWMGPLLLRSLVTLGATPACRARAAQRGQPDPEARSWLESMREQRARRGL